MKRALAFTLMVLAIMIIAVSCEEPHVHSFTPEWSYDDTHHWHKAACGHEEVSEKGEHVWKEGGDKDGWIVDVASTETEEGKKHRECSVCGYIEEGKVPLKGHVHTYSSYSSNSDKHWRTCTGCGETFTYTHTFSTYVDGGTGTDGHYPKCNCGYKKTTIEAHVYTGTQKVVSGTTVCNVCDMCGHLDEVNKKDTNTGVETAGKEVSIGTTTTVNGAKVNSEKVDIPVAVAAAETSDKSTTTVTFPKGALKVDDNASTVSLIVKAASIATASSSDYRETLSDKSDESVVVINSTEAVVAGFEFKLKGADGSDLTGSELADDSTTKKKGTTVETFIAPGLVDKKNLTIKYVGNSVKETDENKAEINEYRTSDGYLKFTVYHFSKYAIIANTLVAKDNDGTMYFTSESETPAAVLEKALKTAVTSYETGKDVVITLLVDIDLKNKEWTPVGDGTRNGSGIGTGSGFKGTFDGNGHTISNLKISSGNADSCVGLFGILDGGTVENLKLEKVNISVPSCKNVGAVVGLAVNEAMIKNVTVGSSDTNDKSTVSGDAVGGVVGRMTINCKVSGCTNYATVSTGEKGTGGAGGIVCKAYYSKDNSMQEISGCKNYGNVSGPATNCVGGIVAYTVSTDIKNCENHGTISGLGYAIGGIVGEFRNRGSVTNSTNKGSISSTSSVSTGGVYGLGGIVGWIRYLDDGVTATSGKAEDYMKPIEITENTNNGTIDGENAITGAGGIVGMVFNTAKITKNENYAKSVTGYTFVSGIVGGHQIEKDNLLKDCIKSTEVIGNTSTTTSITAGDGSCRSDVIYLNPNGAVSPDVVTVIYDNNPDTNDSEACASISDENTYYKTFGEAISDATSGGTIKLLKNIELSAPMTNSEESTLIIDLNGKTITFSGATMTGAISNNGKLTLKNGTIEYKNGQNYPSGGVNYSVISNSGSLTTSALAINVNVEAACEVPMASFSTAIADDNSCPGVFVVTTSGIAIFDDTDITLNVEQAVSGNAGLVSSNGKKFAGVKPIIVFQNGNGTTTIKNGSVLTSTTSVPGGVIGLYMDSSSKVTATIVNSTIEVTNRSLGWARPVFAHGKGTDVATNTIEVILENSTIKSHDTLTKTQVTDVLEYLTNNDSEKISEYSKILNTGVNRVYGLRAKENSVITFDSATEVTVDKIDNESDAALLQYAADTKVDYTKDQADAGIRGQIKNGSGKYWNYKTKTFVTTLE